jgi:hypothetical protein
MAILMHEIWVDPAGHHTCCLAGPEGDGLRKLSPPGSTLVSTFEAGSHFEAMTVLHAFLKRAPYVSEQEWEQQTYPETFAPTA